MEIATKEGLSNLVYFANHPAPKYHFIMQIDRLDYTNEWEYDIRNWDEPPATFCRKTLQLLQFSCNNLEYALFKMKQFADRTGCSFIGEHYQFPGNRVVKVSIEPGTRYRSTPIRNLTVGKPLGFYRYVKKTFGFKIDEPTLNRISEVGYPEIAMHERLRHASIIYTSNLAHVYQNQSRKK